MTRRAARITHDEVVRALKAARSAGMTVRSFSVVGDRIEVVADNGDIVDNSPNALVNPDTFQSLEDYEAWRDGNRARGN